MGIRKMISVIVGLSVFSTVLAVTPLTAEELQQIREFTNKAHMKRMNVYPDQLMTPSHYLGRRLPLPEKQPTIFMQVPSNINAAASKPTTFTVEPQPAGAVQNYFVNYTPVASNNVGQAQQQQQQVQQHGQNLQQRPQPQQQQYSFVPLQNPNGHLRGPPPPQQRPPLFSISEATPASSLLSLFFPKRLRRPTFRLPFRFEYSIHPGNARPGPSPLYQHQQNLQSVMAQQHLQTVHQQQQQQQQQAQSQQAEAQAQQPSASPSVAQTTTLKTPVGAQVTPTGIPAGHHNGIVQNAPQLILNQYHKEIPPQFYGKPFGKPNYPPKFSPFGGFVPHNRPGDAQNYIQKYAGPQDYSFLPVGPHVPPVIAGPTSNKYPGPISFSHIEQMPYPFQPHSLPMAMVVQSQEFPNYHFSTSFTATSSENPQQATPASVSIANNLQGVHGGVVSSVQSASSRQPQRVKKLRPRPVSVPTTTTIIPPSSTQSLGEIIFESSKETREFHDSARVEAPVTVEVVKPTRKTKPIRDQSSLQKLESSVVLAPLVFTKESSEPLHVSTSSPLAQSSTSVSVSTVSTTTLAPFKEKPSKSKGGEHHHHHHNHKSKIIQHEKRVTASGAGQTAVTSQPPRVTSTGSASSSSSRSTISPGRVVTTSVTSRVVSVGPNGHNSQNKRLRLRKVKVPNPDAKPKSNRQTSTTTTTLPSTTESSTRIPSRSTTITSTESSLTTTS